MPSHPRGTAVTVEAALDLCRLADLDAPDAAVRIERVWLVDHEVRAGGAEVAGIEVRFGGVVALDGPDIVVRPAEIVDLIGSNGAGKTTLMNAIPGSSAPTTVPCGSSATR